MPIHHHLIDLDFLEYVQGTTTHTLFDKVPNTNKYGKTTSALSKWWGEVVRSQGVDTKAPAHEFRHTNKSELRELGVPDSTSDRGALGISSIYKG